MANNTVYELQSRALCMKKNSNLINIRPMCLTSVPAVSLKPALLCENKEDPAHLSVNNGVLYIENEGSATIRQNDGTIEINL